MARKATNIANLKPFKKGQCGNPKGKPKGIEHSKTRLLRLLNIVQKTKNPVTGEIEAFTVLEKMDAVMIGKALKGDLSAYKEIIDRIEGKATNFTDLTTGGKEIKIILPNAD